MIQPRKPYDINELLSCHGDLEAVSNLLSSRLIFVMGKGGTGKTTLSVCLAFIAEKMGLTTLIVEIGDSAGTAQFFGESDAGNEPSRVSSRIWTTGVDPRAELVAYTHHHMKSGFIAGRITKSRLFDYLLAATPGLKEIMTLGRIWRWFTGGPDKDGPAFDRIIVDAPATGHGLSLLSLPKNLGDMIRVGPIAAQVEDIRKLVTDSSRTAVTVATLPEELPVNETLEMMAAAKRDVGVDVSPIFINSVYPDIFTSEESEDIKRFFPDRGQTRLIKSWVNRCQSQQAYIDQILANVTCPVIRLPFFFTNELSTQEVRKLSWSLKKA
ncbi:MAG: ArsA family ATPase [Deltaproteobacteria bacterium]|nr:ArsA family ATPase [Deltaproteobacteria bacterium]